MAELGNENSTKECTKSDNKDSKINIQKGFLGGLNKCNTTEELQQYINNIIDAILRQQTSAKLIGARKGMNLSGELYQDGGYYDKFISPETQILNDTLGSGYHIYDREYLYEFAEGIRRMKLDKDFGILQYIMPFLDKYFGLPKDNVDRREDTFWKVCEPYAEGFYNRNGIAYYEFFGSAIECMQFNGEFPLRALKGQNVAQCVERSCLAQNILKMCGYDSSINFGEAESRGKAEGHAWNVIRYGNGYLLIDFNNTVHEIENGKVIGRKPFSFNLSVQDFEEYRLGKKNLMARDFHYEKGEKIYESKYRVYAVGRSIDKINSRKGISPEEFKEAADDPKSIDARPNVFKDMNRARENDLRKENPVQQGG